jgi:putative membrane-bound dehydrogenase-like protein
MPNTVRTILLASALLAYFPIHAAEPAKKSAEVKSPLPPEEALQHFRVAPGLRVELVAAEPDVESPVAVAFDEDGRLWVVEMRDYPNGPAKGQPPQGRIRILEDRDGSGRYRHQSFFADKLLFANGLLPWRGGVIVTAAPHILYLSDTKRTGVADQRQVLFEGFAAENPQLRVSHPILGIDNWIYTANGLRGGQIKRAGKNDPPLNVSGMDFRFNPTDERYEAISGLGQFGNTFDDWGNRFVCDNRHHLRHIVLPNQYVKRNPFLGVAAVLEDISETEATSTVAGAGAQVYPISKTWTTSNLHAGHFTAACGVFVYRGDRLPAEYRGCAFTCEPTGNLVHQEVMRPHGATFRSKPPRDKVEFLATTDEWCRPVSMAHGPDGALYVVDMYRAVIEHPEFMPPELKHRPDLLLGKDRGRIWRIVPEKNSERPKKPQLSKATTAELVALLESPDAWRRTTAQRLLLERSDNATVPLLRKLYRTAVPPLGRLHAAWLLDAFQALKTEDVLQFLEDSNPRVREHAVHLAERWLAKDAAIQEHVVALAADSDARLRYQVALSLGEWDDDRILPPLAKIALLGVEDRWTRMAVATAVPKRPGALIAVLCQDRRGLTSQLTPDRLALLQELATLVGARRDPDEVANVLTVLGTLPGSEAGRWQMAGLNGLADGMGRRGTQLAAFLQTLPATKKTAVDQATKLLNGAAEVAANAKRDSHERLAAVGLLAHAPWPTASPTLTALVADEPAQEVRLAAIRALAAHPRDEVPGILLKSWRNHTPAARREIIEVLLRQPDRALFFLKEIEAGRIKANDLDPLRSRQLVNHSRADVRELATKLLKGNLPADRKQVLERYQAALKLKGDTKRGLAVFQKNCATCHLVNGVGHVVGPDISDLRTKTADQLLLDILDPNAAIDSNYVNYSVTTKGGKVLTGLIASETASSLTLKRAENQTDVVLRTDIEEITSSGVSLMPDGLEKTVSIEEMADLLHYLKNWRYAEGGVPVGEK